MKLSLACGAFALMLVAGPALAQSDPIGATTKAVDQAGRDVSAGIDAQTKWVGQTLDDFLSDPSAPPPADRKRHQFDGKK